MPALLAPTRLGSSTARSRLSLPIIKIDCLWLNHRPILHTIRPPSGVGERAIDEILAEGPGRP